MTLLDEVMSTLEDVDVLQKEYNSVVDMNAKLKGSLMEHQMTNRLLEERCSDLEAERASLLEVHDESVRTALAQYDFREKYEKLLLSSTEENDRQREEAQREAQALQTQMRVLQEKESSERALRVGETEKLQNECFEKDATINTIQRELEAAQGSLLEAKREKDEAQSKEQRKSMTAKMKFEEQLRDSGSNRHVEIFKQKVMQLRRENEDLKRRLQSAAPR